MSKKKFKRKVIIVDKDFQIRFVRKFLSITLFGTLIAVAIILAFYYFTYKYGGMDLNRYLIEIGVDPRVPFITTDRFYLALPVAGLIAGIYLILAVLMGMFYSHKLAGPIYRIEKSILALINGTRNLKVKLRKGDEFNKLADTINRLVDYSNNNTEIIKETKALIDQYTLTQNPEFLKKAKERLDTHIEDIDE